MLTFASLCPVTALAGLTEQTLNEAGFHFAPGAQLPLSSVFNDGARHIALRDALGGRPALLIFVDYRCQSLCGVVLDELGETLPRMPLKLGRDYSVVSVALDSAQTTADANAFRDRHTAGSPLQGGGRFLTEEPTSLNAIEASVGLVAPYDAEHGQFAHPAGLVLLDSTGRAQRVISPFALDPFDLKLALSEAGAGTPTFATQALLLCYAFNGVTGLYTPRIERVLAVAAAATLILLGGGIGLALWRERRRRFAG